MLTFIMRPFKRGVFFLGCIQQIVANLPPEIGRQLTNVSTVSSGDISKCL